MVIGYVPAGVDPTVPIVSTVEQAGVQDVDEKDAVAPEGSPETLKGIRKGATADDNLRAARLAKEAGLKLYGFFLVGLPWEDQSHLDVTARHIYDIDADFIELHIAVPYYGTELYHIAKAAGVLDDTVIGKDYFNGATTGTLHLPTAELVEYRRKLLLDYHLRPKYLARKIRDAMGNPAVLYNYWRFGSRLILNNLRPRQAAAA